MAREQMTLDEFRVKFNEIKAKGFIPSTRNGPTGIGHTFETAIGYHEDNIALPDLGEVELKAKRSGSGSMITLFTLDRNAWVMNQLDAIRKYGTIDKKIAGRLGMYFTLGSKPNGSGIYQDAEDGYAVVKHTDGTVIAKWSVEALANQFIRKFPGLCLVSADTEIRNGREYFHFNKATVLKGTSVEIMRQCIDDGTILIDLRLHDKGTCARNHGTGFRTFENRLPKLFSNIQDL